MTSSLQAATSDIKSLSPLIGFDHVELNCEVDK